MNGKPQKDRKIACKPGPIVLLTDFGGLDHYAGCLKGVIRSLCPAVEIIDLSHGVEPRNIIHGSYLLENSRRYFPEGSIFVCIVDPGVGSSRKIIALRTPRSIFIGPDNGLLAPVVAGRNGKKNRIEIRSIENERFFWERTVSATFHGRDIMAPAAARLAAGASFRELGPRISTIQPLKISGPQHGRSAVMGQILFFDHYGNAITNLRRRDLGSRPLEGFKIYVQKRKTVRPVSHYCAQAKKALCALINSAGYLELAWPEGSAKAKARLRAGDPVRVVYEK